MAIEKQPSNKNNGYEDRQLLTDLFIKSANSIASFKSTLRERLALHNQSALQSVMLSPDFSKKHHLFASAITIVEKAVFEDNNKLQEWTQLLATLKSEELAKDFSEALQEKMPVNKRQVDGLIDNIEDVKNEPKEENIPKVINDFYTLVNFIPALDVKTQTNLFALLYQASPHILPITALNNTFNYLEENVKSLSELVNNKNLDINYFKKVAYAIEKTTRTVAMNAPAILAGDTYLLAQSLSLVDKLSKQCQHQSIPRKIIKYSTKIAKGLTEALIITGLVLVTTLLGCPWVGIALAIPVDIFLGRYITGPIFNGMRNFFDKHVYKVIPQKELYKKTEKHSAAVVNSLTELQNKLVKLSKTSDIESQAHNEAKKNQLLASIERSKDTLSSLISKSESVKELFIPFESVIKAINARVASLDLTTESEAVYRRIANEVKNFESLILVANENIAGLEAGDSKSFNNIMNGLKKYKYETINNSNSVKLHFSSASSVVSSMLQVASMDFAKQLLVTCFFVAAKGLMTIGIQAGKAVVNLSAIAINIVSCFPAWLISKKIEDKIEDVFNNLFTKPCFDGNSREDNARVRDFVQQTKTATCQFFGKQKSSKPVEQHVDELGVGIIDGKTILGH